EELLRFLEGRHRDAAGAGGLLPARDLDALRGLDVRPQANAERGQALLHAHDIAHHARLVDQRGRGWNVGEVQGHHHQSRYSPRARNAGASRAGPSAISWETVRGARPAAVGRSTPTACICRRKSPSATAARSASLRRPTTAAGVPLGTNNAFQARMFTSP